MSGVRDNPKNYTYQLMRAQEEKVLMGKITHMKPSVDNKSPKRFKGQRHKTASMGQRKQSVARRREIEQENNTLLLKMLNIMQRGARSTNSSPQFRQVAANLNQTHSSVGVAAGTCHNLQWYLQQQLPGGGIPSHELTHSTMKLGSNHSSQSNIHSPNHYQAPLTPYKVGSLNYYKRKKEQTQITQDNRQLLKALQNVQPVIRRDELVNHENRIKKLKQHLGIIRYGAANNFVYPNSNSKDENHNFHSSQFLFMKNPSALNIQYPLGSSFEKRKRSASNNMLRTQVIPSNSMFSNKEIRAATANSTTHKRNRRYFNQSADFFQEKLRSGTPTNFVVQNSIKPLFPTTTSKSPVAATGSTDEQKNDVSKDDKVFQVLMNEKQKLKEVRGKLNQSSPQHHNQHRRLRSQQKSSNINLMSQTQKSVKRHLEIVSNYTKNNALINSFAPLSTKNPYKNAGKKFVNPRPSSSTRHQMPQAQQVQLFNQVLPTDDFSDNLSLQGQPQAPESTIKFIEPKINIHATHDDEIREFNHNLHLRMNHDNYQLEQNSPQFTRTSSSKQSNLSPTHHQRLDFSYKTNSTALNLIQSSKGQLAPISNQKVLLGANRFIRNLESRQVKVERLVREFVQKLKTRMNEKRKAKKKVFSQLLLRADKGSSSLQITEDTFEEQKTQPLKNTSPNKTQNKLAANDFIQGVKQQSAAKKNAKEFVGALKSNIKQNKETEAQIVAKAQVIFQRIHKLQLQRKVPILVRRFVQNFKAKVEQKRQIKKVYSNFAKNFLKSNASNNAMIEQKKTKEEVKVQDVVAQLKRVHLNNDKNQLKTINERYHQMSLGVKAIIQAFFDLMKRRVRVKVLTKQFISNLKKQAANKFLYKQLNKKLASRLHIFIQPKDSPNKLEQQDSSIHYSQTSSLGKDQEEASKIQHAKEFLERLQAQGKVKQIVKQVKDVIKKNNRQEVIQKHAIKFIEILRQNLIIKQKARKIVHNYVKQLRKRLKSQKQAENASRFININNDQQVKNKSNAMKFYQKLKVQSRNTKISEIQDAEFQQGIRDDFKKLLIKLFQLSAQRRNSFYFVTRFYGSLFRDSVLWRLRKAYQLMLTQQNKNEQQVQQIQAFLHINELRSKYIRDKGLVRAKEYISKLREQVEKKRSIVKLMVKRFRSHQQPFNISKIQDITFTKSCLQAVKLFLTRLFTLSTLKRQSKIHALYLGKQLKSGIISAVRNYLQKNAHKVPDEQKAQMKIVQGFVYIQEMREREIMKKGQQKAKEYIYKIRKRVQEKRKPLRFMVQQIKAFKAQNFQRSFVYEITDQKLLNALFRDFRYFLAHAFQLKTFNNFTLSYKFRLFKSNIQKHFQTHLLFADTSLQQSMLAYIKLNQIRIKQLEKRGLIRAKEYLLKLKTKAEMRKNPLRSMFKQINLARQNADSSWFNIIKDESLIKAIQKDFRQLVAMIFQRDSSIRTSRISLLYLIQQFRVKLIKRLKAYIFQKGQNPSLLERPMIKSIQAYIKINEIKQKLIENKAEIMIKRFLHGLLEKIREKKTKTKNFALQLRALKAFQKPENLVVNYIWSNEILSSQVKKSFNHFLARLFQKPAKTSRFHAFFLGSHFNSQLLRHFLDHTPNTQHHSYKSFKAYTIIQKIKQAHLQTRGLHLAKSYLELLRANAQARKCQSMAVGHLLSKLNKQLFSNEEEEKGEEVRDDESYSIGSQHSAEFKDGEGEAQPSMANRFVQGLMKKYQKPGVKGLEEDEDESPMPLPSYNIVINDGKGPEATTAGFQRQVTNVKAIPDYVSKANRVVQQLMKQEDTTEQNVKKFVNIFKTSYGKGKLPTANDYQ